MSSISKYHFAPGRQCHIFHIRQGLFWLMIFYSWRSQITPDMVVNLEVTYPNWRAHSGNRSMRSIKTIARKGCYPDLFQFYIARVTITAYCPLYIITREFMRTRASPIIRVQIISRSTDAPEATNGIVALMCATSNIWLAFIYIWKLKQSPWSEIILSSRKKESYADEPP